MEEAPELRDWSCCREMSCTTIFIFRMFLKTPYFPGYSLVDIWNKVVMLINSV